MTNIFMQVTGIVFGVLAGLAYVAFIVARMFFIGFFIAILRMTITTK